jgi:hypothetical protein
LFFDQRLFQRAGLTPTFPALELLGEQAFALHRGARRGHLGIARPRRASTPTSSLMCWAACDRLAKIAQALGLERPGEGLDAPRVRDPANDPARAPGARGASPSPKASTARRWTPACS